MVKQQSFALQLVQRNNEVLVILVICSFFSFVFDFYKTDFNIAVLKTHQSNFLVGQN